MNSTSIQLNEALSIFEDHLDDIKSALMENMLHNVNALPKLVPTDNATLDWVRKSVRELEIESMVAIPTHVIKRIVSRQQHILRPDVSSITDDMIARAKDFPIEELYDGQLRHGSGLCPFHSEKTPSFHIKKNRYKCYGCGEYGDSISFYMKMNNCNFIQAVKALQ